MAYVVMQITKNPLQFNQYKTGEKMLIINFGDTPLQAFGRGFLKGMAAPYLLYGAFEAPQLPQVQAVVPYVASPEATFAADRARVENDIAQAISTYGVEQAEA